MMKQMFSVILLTVAVGAASVLAGPTQAIQEHGKAMLRDAEAWSCTEAWATAAPSCTIAPK
ncbi:MAG TPA: hypothetical protein VN666_17085 [Nitrospira sp.]|nr:hypothetical protein [Nitrospira sp.]